MLRLGEGVSKPALSEYAVQLLRMLEDFQWAFSPRILSHSSDSTVLSYIDGDAALHSHARRMIEGPKPLAAVARMTRSLHDLTAGTACAVGAEVACHNDLDPRNTVYRHITSNPAPVAFIDWDLASPGQRVHDLAHVCWTFTGLGPGADRRVVIDRIEDILRAYGWQGTYHEVVEAIIWWQERCWRGIQAGADGGSCPPSPTRQRCHRRGEARRGMDAPEPLIPKRSGCRQPS